jgi:hypothetical protein
MKYQKTAPPSKTKIGGLLHKLEFNSTSMFSTEIFCKSGDFLLKNTSSSQKTWFSILFSFIKTWAYFVNLMDGQA